MDAKKQEEEKNKDKKITLPPAIKEAIDTKGFYLYKWISPKDVKKSIERDFLKILNFI